MLLLRPKRSIALSTPTQPTLLPQLELALDFGAPLDFGTPGPAKPSPRRDSNAASVRVTTQRSAAPVLPSIPVSAPLAMPTTPTTHSRSATTTHERTPSLSSASSSNYSNTPTTPNTSVTNSPGGGSSPKARHSPTHQFVPHTHVLDEKHLARALTARRRSPPAVHVRRDSVLTARRDSTISNVKRGRPTSPVSPVSPYALPPSPRGRSLGARTSSAAASLLARTRARSTATSRQPPTLAPVPTLPPLPPKSLLRDSNPKKRYSSTPPTSPKKQRDSKRDSTMRRILSSLAPPDADAERERKEDESFYAPDADAEEEEFELLCTPADISLAAPNGAKLRRVEKRTVLLVHLPSAAFSVDACERVREFCEGYGEVSTMQAGRAGRVRVEFRDKGVYERVEPGRAQVEGVGVCRVGLERWRGGS